MRRGAATRTTRAPPPRIYSLPGVGGKGKGTEGLGIRSVSTDRHLKQKEHTVEDRIDRSSHTVPMPRIALVQVSRLGRRSGSGALVVNEHAVTAAHSHTHAAGAGQNMT
jgi:hypothetical protein